MLSRARSVLAVSARRHLRPAAPRHLRPVAVVAMPCPTHGACAFSSTAAVTAPPTAPVSSLPSHSPFLTPIGRPRRVLGVETSCDDTALAILDDTGSEPNRTAARAREYETRDSPHSTTDCDVHACSVRRVLSHAAASQWHLFDQFHGVQPMMAAQEHATQIEQVFAHVLAKAALTADDIDGVSVTAGPGLAPCLKVGLSWASEFARSRSLPFVGVHHMQAHAMVAGLDHPELQFPFLALLVSGGHTELWLVESLSRVTILAATVDDAIGEAFDKAARTIGVQRGEGQSPGAAVEHLARQPVQRVHKFAELSRTNMDFSFSGLKAALQRHVFNMRIELARQQQQDAGDASSAASSSGVVLPSRLQNRDIRRLVRETKDELFKDTGDVRPSRGDGSSLAQALPPLPLQDQIDLCHAFQAALIAQLASRTILAIRHCRTRFPHLRLTQLVIAGGVACNQSVRSSLAAAIEPYHLTVLAPRPLHCMDNGIMIAHLGMRLLRQGHRDTYDLCFHTRWPIGTRTAIERVQDDKRGFGPDLRQVDQTKQVKMRSRGG